MSKRKNFKSYCPESYIRIMELAEKRRSQDGTIIELGKDRIEIEVSDPLNTEETICHTIPYKADTEEQLKAYLKSIDDTLRTLYMPNYLTFKPLISTELSNVIKDLDCSVDTAAILVYQEGQKIVPLEEKQTIECFAYNHDDFNRFVEHISEIMLTLKEKQSAAPINQEPCHDFHHCKNCGNSSCQHSPDKIQIIWQGMSKEEQQNFLSSLNPQELEKAMQQINGQAKGVNLDKKDNAFTKATK